MRLHCALQCVIAQYALHQGTLLHAVIARQCHVLLLPASTLKIEGHVVVHAGGLHFQADCMGLQQTDLSNGRQASGGTHCRRSCRSSAHVKGPPSGPSTPATNHSPWYSAAQLGPSSAPASTCAAARVRDGQSAEGLQERKRHEPSITPHSGAARPCAPPKSRAARASRPLFVLAHAPQSPRAAQPRPPLRRPAPRAAAARCPSRVRSLPSLLLACHGRACAP